MYAGMSSDFVTLSIKDGSVMLVANLGAGAFSVMLEPVLGTFSDNQWHNVKVIRKLHRVRCPTPFLHKLVTATERIGL